MSKEITTIIVERIVHKTDQAVLVEYEGKEYWLPLSQVEIQQLNIETDVEITVPIWLLEKNGMI